MVGFHWRKLFLSSLIGVAKLKELLYDCEILSPEPEAAEVIDTEGEFVELFSMDKKKRHLAR